MKMVKHTRYNIELPKGLRAAAKFLDALDAAYPADALLALDEHGDFYLQWTAEETPADVAYFNLRAEYATANAAYFAACYTAGRGMGVFYGSVELAKLRHIADGLHARLSTEYPGTRREYEGDDHAHHVILI